MKLSINVRDMDLTVGVGMTLTITQEQLKTMMNYPAVAEKILRCGLVNILWDCHASVRAGNGMTEEQVKAEKSIKVRMKFASLMAGNTR